MESEIWQSEGWKSEFRKHATPETMQAAVRCATIEIARLRRLTIEVQWDEEDLVQRVLMATWAGRLTWSPDAAPLRTHLRDKIRLACRRLRRRHFAGDGHPVIALDALDDEDALWGEVEAALAERTTDANPTLVDLARRFEAELWDLAARDPIALRVLAAMSAGVTSTTQIAKAAGLPVGYVVNAKGRLRRLAVRVSPPLLGDIGVELNLEGATEDAEPAWSADEAEPTNELTLQGGADARRRCATKG